VAEPFGRAARRAREMNAAGIVEILLGGGKRAFMQEDTHMLNPWRIVAPIPAPSFRAMPQHLPPGLTGWIGGGRS
jgi:hypothetical protein